MMRTRIIYGSQVKYLTLLHLSEGAEKPYLTLSKQGTLFKENIKINTEMNDLWIIVRRYFVPYITDLVSYNCIRWFCDDNLLDEEFRSLNLKIPSK